MHNRLLFPLLAVIALSGQFGTSASAQIFGGTPEGVYEVADQDAPLSLLQRQALAEVREKDRQRYMALARDARIFRKKYYYPRQRLIKPIAEWTQQELWVFRLLYDQLATQRDDLELWSTLELAILVDTVASDGGGSDGEGDE